MGVGSLEWRYIAKPNLTTQTQNEIVDSKIPLLTYSKDVIGFKDKYIYSSTT